MTKFNFTRNSKTPKGELRVTRMLHKDHTIYPIYFDEYGRKRSEEEVKKIIQDLKAAVTKREQD